MKTKHIIIALCISIFTLSTEVKAYVVTSDKAGSWIPAKELHGFRLYWCLDPKNQYPHEGYHDFYIVKTGGTGTARSHGLTFIEKGNPDEYGNSEPTKLVHLGFHREINILDLNNDGVCEVTAVVGSHGRKWGPNAGYGLITKIYSVINYQLVDVTNKMATERDLLYKEETDRMIRRYLNENNRVLYSSYSPKQNAMSPVLNFWYHIFAINPNSYGIDLFNKYRTFKLSKNHAKEIENELLREGYWSEEFYKTHPLLNLANN